MTGTQGAARSRFGVVAVRVVVGPSPSVGGFLFRDPDGAYLGSDPSVGAILASTFTVTATPVAGSAAGCRPVSAETTVDRNGTFTRNDDRVVAYLDVARQASPSGVACHYQVTTGLPAGFVAASAGSTQSSVRSYTQTTTTFVHNVRVAVRDVFVTQNVTGDAGGGSARYSLTESRSCGAQAGAPRVSVVGLHEGGFNVSRAVLGPAGSEDADGRFGASRYALNHKAEPCVVTVGISHLPAGCAAGTTTQARDLTTDVDAANRAILGFHITCPAAPGIDMSPDNTGEDMLVGGPPADIPTG